ncbi:hypothetical protein CYY_001634 [Polysphondylium violaceum]|uniref:Ubiquinone biosynthesis protein n=1 Tax=Polysphondylium violaceum TaxID=133409 RepID=A0A8J4Q2S4_9MYCE|nr:hypothetical protein CYY_001634 [Polysphondylium violaceum]
MASLSRRFVQKNLSRLSLINCGIRSNSSFYRSSPSLLSTTRIQSSCSSSSSSLFNNQRFYCSVNNNSNNNNQQINESQQQQQQEQKQQQQQQQEFSKDKILESSLQFVNLYGWTSEAVSKGCIEMGYPPVTQGIIGDNSGFELALYFIKKCNKELFDQLSESDLLHGLSKKDKVKLAIKSRLSMIKPYQSRWSEAMQLLANPKNLQTTLPTMQTLVDDIWHAVGDRSSDFDWYAKRALLAALYTSSELFMLTDTSPEHSNTMRFVDDRVEDLIKTIKLKNDVESTVSMAVGTFLNTIHKSK